MQNKNANIATSNLTGENSFFLYMKKRYDTIAMRYSTMYIITDMSRKSDSAFLYGENSNIARTMIVPNAAIDRAIYGDLFTFTFLNIKGNIFSSAAVCANLPLNNIQAFSEP